MGTSLSREDAGTCFGNSRSITSVAHSVEFSPVTSREGLDVQAFLESLVQDGRLIVREEDLPPDYGPAHVDVLHRALETRMSICSLHIGNVGSTVARHFAESLLRAPHIMEAKFTGTQADDALAKVLGVMLQPIWLRAPTLQRLVIANTRKNQLTDVGGLRLAQALEENRSLRTLVLSSTQLGDVTMHGLIAALEVNEAMEVLVFNGKYLTGKGMRLLNEWLVVGTVRLKELIVGGVSFGDADATAMAQAVVKRRTAEPTVPLRKVGVLNANLGDACGPAVAQLIGCGVDEASFLMGSLSNEGAINLATALKSVERMPRLLVLASQAAGDAAMVAFEDFWSAKTGSRLRSMDLAFGNVSTEMLHSLNARCSSMLESIAKERTMPIMAESRAPEPIALRRLHATENFAEFLEEVLFPRLMLRDRPMLLV